MSHFMLSDEDTINDVNPFVERDFSLPGGIGRAGDFANFSYTREEEGMTDVTKSVYCDYSLCKEGVACHLNRPLYPQRNIDTGFVDKASTNTYVRIGVANRPQFSLTGWIIFLLILFTILYYVRR